MAWFQVDDQLATHRKVCDAGNAAMGLWVRAGAWCMANLTEGFIPTTAARTLGTAGQAARLVAVGLWVRVDGGYQFHEWGTRQLSAEQIAERRRKRAEAGRKGGQSRSKPQANASASAQAKPDQNPTPVPVLNLSGETWEGNGTSTSASDLTNTPRCRDHLNDPNPPRCGGCADARRTAETRARVEADERAARAQAFRAEVATCPDCDDNGFTDGDGGVTRCPNHHWSYANA